MARAELSERIRFLQIDEGTQQHLRAFLPVLVVQIPSILQRRYGEIGKWPVLRRMFGGQAAMARASDAQRRHWARLFQGELNGEYYVWIQRIGKVHNDIGLEPRWYIGGYARDPNQIIGTAITTKVGRWRGDCGRMDLEDCLHAVIKTVMLDMELAISTYFDENKTKHDQAIGTLADELNRSFGSVAATADGLQGSAEVISAVAEQSIRQALAVTSAAEQLSVNL